VNAVDHHGRTTAYRIVDGPDDDRLYVHGSRGDWRVRAAQYGRGQGGIAVDLSGRGDSRDVAAGSALSAYVDDVVAVTRETGVGVLVGNSLGGAVVLSAALDRVDPDALVLRGTGAGLTVADDLLGLLATDEGFEAAIDRLYAPDRFFHDPSERLRERSKAALRGAGRTIVERDFGACDGFDVRDRLGELAVPTLGSPATTTGSHRLTATGNSPLPSVATARSSRTPPTSPCSSDPTPGTGPSTGSSGAPPPDEPREGRAVPPDRRGQSSASASPVRSGSSPSSTWLCSSAGNRPSSTAAT